MLDAGFDPAAMITMFEKLMERYKREPGRLEKLFITHPPTAERIENLKALLVETPRPEGLKLSTPEFEEIKIRVDELYPAPQPDENWGKPATEGDDAAEDEDSESEKEATS
jgi:predicted Zn-dependent protease